MEYAAKLLRAGDVVAFPTETVYGLGAVVFDVTAVQRVFTAKGRPSDNPLIVHCASLADVERIAVNVPEHFFVLYERFCPGPLTMLLPRHPDLPKIVTAGLETVAVRFPRHPLAIELIRRVGAPLVAPSANRSGYPSPTMAQHVMNDLAGRIAAVIDGGTCEIGMESTVVNILAEPPMVLRPGTITQQMLESALHTHVTDADSVRDADLSASPASPGMKYRHYAPNAQVWLAKSLAEALRLWQEAVSPVWILALPESNPPEHKNQSGMQGINVHFFTAATLYETLRRADDERVQTVIVLCDEALRADAALLNRLQKAAERG
jgi:L-threonylcarbamoyladenylate synthase